MIAIDFDSALPAAAALSLTGVPLIYDVQDNFAMRPNTPSVMRPLVAWLDQQVIKRAWRITVADESRITGFQDDTMRQKLARNLQLCEGH